MTKARVGVALSGGTAKCIAHIGVLEALEDAGVSVSCIAGTSGGAIIGVLYAAGFTIPELKALVRGIKWTNLARVSVPRLGLLSNDVLKRFLAGLLGERTFDQLRIPTAVVATSLLTGDRAIFTTGNVALAAQASSAVPQLFAPVEVGGEMFVDGGLVEFLPLAALRDTFQPEVMVGVNLGMRGPLPRPRNLIQLGMVIGTVMARQTVRHTQDLADVIIHPDTRLFHPFDLDASQGLIEVGYLGAAAEIEPLGRAVRRFDRDWTPRPVRGPQPAAGREGE
jgi:NTE family protein